MLTDDALRERLRKSRNADADSVAFLPFRDVDQSIRDDLALYAASPLVRHDIPVRGFVYDVKTGRLREVKARGPSKAPRSARTLPLSMGVQSDFPSRSDA